MRAILLRVEWVVLCVLSTWCMYAFAQARAVTFGAELLEIQLLVWLLAVGLSLSGGLVSLLPKLHDPEHRAGSVPLLIASHMASSLGAGMLTFFKGNAENVSDWDLAPAIFIAGFAGAWLLEKARMRLFGAEPAPPTEPDRRSGIDRREE